MAWFNAGLSSNSGGASSFNELDDVSINTQTLSNGQVPIYNSTTHKWENGEQSGGSSGHTIIDDGGTSLTQRDNLQFKGAYSEDNSTNEKTVVNVVREMTKAQFDLLSADEKTGFINITDITGGNDDRFQPVIYSTEEREIGVWKNGKPLYEKMVYNAGGTYGEIYIQHGVSNIDQIVYAEGVCADSGATPYNYYPFSRISPDGFNIGISVTTTTGVAVYVPSAFGQRIVDIYVTFRYTKTTDTPGSGQWTPQGVPAHHYSTDEQIVGTWIDGKPLYEKTIVEKNISYQTTGTNYTLDTISNVDEVVEITGTITNSAKTTKHELPYINDTLKVTVVRFDMTSGNIQLRSFDTWSSLDVIVTLRYTKTST